MKGIRFLQLEKWKNLRGRKSGKKGFIGIEFVIMVPLAICFDVFGPLVSSIPLIGWAASPMIAIFGFFFFNGWMWFRGSTKIHRRSAAKQKLAKQTQKLAKIARRFKWLKFATPIIEAIPYINFLPMWTIVVLLELKSSPS